MRKWINLVLVSSIILLSASVAPTFVSAEDEKTQGEQENVQNVGKAGGRASTKGNVGLKGNPDPDYPVNPGQGAEEDEELIETTDGATEGPYSISYISNFKFGTQFYEKGKDNTFFAKNDEIRVDKSGGHQTVKKPNFVQISDASGSKNGWKVYVQLEGPLKNENETTIDNMSLRLDNILVSPILTDLNDFQNPANITIQKKGVELTGKDNAPKLVGEAKGMQGQGRWHILFGKTVENGEKSVSLFFPKGSIKEPGKYQTNLVWTFGDVK
ncbi:WxL domain-containing protein [Vagococcus silagei]|uniref:WxL domain-containing protein n=1 Tax=Vagococcus silagei TaxID=2508885 RepID=A0A4S3B5E7_9ENTE|nr:WxL domain-containing protein [Vagococcus silagei]THB62334.1 WxL domain-containing protein [Vagococcus silagei]